MQGQDGRRIYLMRHGETLYQSRAAEGRRVGPCLRRAPGVGVCAAADGWITQYDSRVAADDVARVVPSAGQRRGACSCV